MELVLPFALFYFLSEKAVWLFRRMLLRIESDSEVRHIDKP